MICHINTTVCIIHFTIIYIKFQSQFFRKNWFIEKLDFGTRRQIYSVNSPIARKEKENKKAHIRVRATVISGCWFIGAPETRPSHSLTRIRTMKTILWSRLQWLADVESVLHAIFHKWILQNANFFLIFRWATDTRILEISDCSIYFIWILYV